ncbi:hypothetical protein O0I10_010155 [Lichtheimia ornata]|uniref:Uncharacterized protein n=1 Tax=Lichtheimia ornata TaxID=688661 RepID=A0AAD7UVF4_9FUNG|nr:uncharacterized protein O0I10_010155 [Lichtheimia ornata]KAJ8654207.1 hypothetical protein O0I10_010155 [Lichtheimia ornata]
MTDTFVDERRPSVLSNGATLHEQQIPQHDLVIQPIPSRGTVDLPPPQLATVTAADDKFSKEVLEEDQGPDGGFGWFVVLGTFMVQFTAFGTAASWLTMTDPWIDFSVT